MNIKRIAFLGALVLAGYAASAVANRQRAAITWERVMRLGIPLIIQLLKSQPKRMPLKEGQATRRGDNKNLKA